MLAPTINLPVATERAEAGTRAVISGVDIVSLEPYTLEDVYENMRSIAAALGVPGRGEGVARQVTAAKVWSQGVRIGGCCVTVEDTQLEPYSMLSASYASAVTIQTTSLCRMEGMAWLASWINIHSEGVRVLVRRLVLGLKCYTHGCRCNASWTE